MLEEVEALPENGGVPIAEPAAIIMAPAVETLWRSLGLADRPHAQADYEALIEACNRCHTATEHEFIRILPVEGAPRRCCTIRPRRDLGHFPSPSLTTPQRRTLVCRARPSG
jgi:hypothetical protein